MPLGLLAAPKQFGVGIYRVDITVPDKDPGWDNRTIRSFSCEPAAPFGTSTMIPRITSTSISTRANFRPMGKRPRILPVSVGHLRRMLKIQNSARTADEASKRGANRKCEVSFSKGEVLGLMGPSDQSDLSESLPHIITTTQLWVIIQRVMFECLAAAVLFPTVDAASHDKQAAFGRNVRRTSAHPSRLATGAGLLPSPRPQPPSTSRCRGARGAWAPLCDIPLTKSLRLRLTKQKTHFWVVVAGFLAAWLGHRSTLPDPKFGSRPPTDGNFPVPLRPHPMHTVALRRPVTHRWPRGDLKAAPIFSPVEPEAYPVNLRECMRAPRSDVADEVSQDAHGPKTVQREASATYNSKPQVGEYRVRLRKAHLPFTGPRNHGMAAARPLGRMRLLLPNAHTSTSKLTSRKQIACAGEQAAEWAHSVATARFNDGSPACGREPYSGWKCLLSLTKRAENDGNPRHIELRDLIVMTVVQWQQEDRPEDSQ
ncbi:hypothetical protein BS47DRAFT_1381504 [Hydnum rufescens UP504]|uniref:Uncharacterized protein n=1 Tax=Hydnum rufescens UP504 TaxID=1448309 RepID=A0A9P6B0K3_9AGAM|nr:hypothetical protein BS47DRAFT_1381504 [Hydnum rufescens UP504]